MNSVRRAAKAIRDQDRETADRGVREVEYADVKRINPLVLEMQESSLVLDNDDLSLTAWVRAYDAEIGIAKGDTAVVKQMRHGVWLVSDVLTPSATPTFGGSGIYQPLDSDLTAIAALTTTAYGRSLLALADAAAGRTLLGLVIGTDVQAYDGDLAAIAGLTSAADKGIQFTGAGTAGTFDLTAAAKTVLDDATVGAMLTTMGGLSSVTAASTYQPLDSDLTAIAALTTTAYGRSVLALADAAAARTLFGLVIGTDVQGYDAELAAIAGLTSAADRLPYFTGAGTASLATFTAAGRALVDDADAAAQRTTLGLVIGTNVQAYDAELAAIAGLTSAADRLPYFTGLGTASLATFTAAGRALIDDADATAQRTTLGLGSLATASTINGGNWSGTDLAVVDGGTGASTAAAAQTNLGIDTTLEKLVYAQDAQNGLVGGGTTTFDSSWNIKWSQRFLAINVGRGANTAASGYFDIDMPPNGTVITGYGGAANQTVAGGLIPMATWTALWYELPLTFGHTGLPGNFKITSYSSNFQVPSSWVLIAQINSDVSPNVMMWGDGRRQTPGTTVPSNQAEARNLGTVHSMQMTYHGGTSAVTAGTTYDGYILLPSAQVVTGLIVGVGAAAGNMRGAIYSESGATQLGVRSTDFAVAGGFGSPLRMPFTAPTALLPAGRYIVRVTFDAAPTIVMGIPMDYSLGTVGAYATPASTISPPASVTLMPTVGTY